MHPLVAFMIDDNKRTLLMKQTDDLTGQPKEKLIMRSQMNKIYIAISLVCLYVLLSGVALAGTLTDNGNGTVTDSGTLLMWQKGENSPMTWEAALPFCEGLSLGGVTDWRLPNIKELSSLVNDAKMTEITIDTTMFPGTHSASYWSSTTNSANSVMAWEVLFSYGSSNCSSKINSLYVRCVRGGQ